MGTCFDLDKMKLQQVTPRSVQRLSQSLWFFLAALEKTDIVKAVGVPPHSHLAIGPPQSPLLSPLTKVNGFANKI